MKCNNQIVVVREIHGNKEWVVLHCEICGAVMCRSMKGYIDAKVEDRVKIPNVNHERPYKGVFFPIFNDGAGI